MSETKFTPGPWIVKKSEWGISVQCEKAPEGLPFAVTPICEIEQEPDTGGLEDAALIAAAPDMYEALENALRDMDKIDAVCKMANVHEFSLMRAEIEKALKKARGE